MATPYNTQNADAAKALEAGIRGFITWHTYAMGYLDQAMADDLGFALPKLTEG